MDSKAGTGLGNVRQTLASCNQQQLVTSVFRCCRRAKLRAQVKADDSASFQRTSHATSLARASALKLSLLHEPAAVAWGFPLLWSLPFIVTLPHRHPN